MGDGLRIGVDDPGRPVVRALLQEHLDEMRALSPPESVHALDLDGLRAPDVTFWTAWAGAELAACGALRELSPDHAEIKSMRTPTAFRGRGAGRAMLQHLLTVARERGYRRLSLETGSTPEFLPARRLYESVGFGETGPFGDYVLDPYSVYLTLSLDPV